MGSTSACGVSSLITDSARSRGCLGFGRLSVLHYTRPSYLDNSFASSSRLESLLRRCPKHLRSEGMAGSWQESSLLIAEVWLFHCPCFTLGRTFALPSRSRLERRRTLPPLRKVQHSWRWRAMHTSIGGRSCAMVGTVAAIWDCEVGGLHPPRHQLGEGRLG